MAYQYGSTRPQAPRLAEELAQWRVRAEVAEAKLEHATKALDTANRSARKYKSLYEKGNVEIRNSVAAQMNQLHERIHELEAEQAPKDRRIAYLERRLHTRLTPRDPEGTQRLREAVAEMEQYRPQGRKKTA